MPALLTRTPIPPPRSITSAVAAVTAAASVTSTFWKVPALSLLSWTSQTATRAPAAANRRAVARPMPVAPPVTMTTRPVKAALPALGRPGGGLGRGGLLLLAGAGHHAIAHAVAGGDVGGVGGLHPLELVRLQVALLILLATAAPADIVAPDRGLRPVVAGG